MMRAVTRGAVLVTALATTAAAFQSLDTTSKLGRGDVFVPDVEQLRLGSFGFHLVVSDFYWLSALQAVGGRDEGGDRDLIAKLVDAVIGLDPWVGHPYRFAAVWLTDSLESVQTANRLLARGVSYHPLEWRNRHHLGFNHFYYLGENAKAAEILASAVGLPKTPRYVAPLVAKLRSQSEGLETTRGFLATLAENTEDPYAQAEYLKSVDEIDTERRARLLDQARAVYVKRFGRDIASVGDLLAGPSPVLRGLPPAHPHFPSFAWEINQETGEIVSGFYGARYRPYEHILDRERRARWLGGDEHPSEES